ncbi:MAG TPA: hypothetical protein VE398_06380, partial [Acidobacteriota bacterium]|nr:hypothetical protein [Acidobacteriota bacterium]
MRFGIIPSTLRERLALLAGMVPVPVVDCLVPLVQTRALMAAVRLGIFEAIGSETRNVADIARSCKVDVGTLDMVLRLMRSTGYIEQSGVGQYRLSSLARRTMLPGARMELRHYVEWNYLQWRLLEHMEELLETGKGLDIHH